LHRRQGPHGFASALLLSLLGVPWETVMEDYLRTNDLWTGHVGRYPELDIDTRAAIVEARTPYLEAAFEVVRADFGGPEAFAERALGLDAPRASGSRRICWSARFRATPVAMGDTRTTLPSRSRSTFPNGR
jgi:Protein tyrosine/serine phosphatase